MCIRDRLVAEVRTSSTSRVPLPLSSVAGPVTSWSPPAGLTSAVAPTWPNAATPTCPTVPRPTACALRARAAVTSQSRTWLGAPSPFWSPPHPAATPEVVLPETSRT